MSDKLALYRQGRESLPARQSLWPLYGAGLENFGLQGGMLEAAVPAPGPRELLVRHDACGLCFSDIKIIKQGAKHPRILRDIRKNPVVMGHEVCMTVVAVGEELRDRYRIGDRFIIQADIYVQGENLAYGYFFQGGLSEYGLIDHRILHGDQGNYLLPVRAETGYAESALAEPWACVIAACSLQYRTALKPGGTAWFVGGGAGSGTQEYRLSAGCDAAGHPARVALTNVPSGFARWLRAQSRKLGFQVLEAPDPAHPPAELERADDIVLLGATAELVEALSPRLEHGGVLAMVTDRPLGRPLPVDVGRIHYQRWLYVGGPGPDIAAVYSRTPARSELKRGGRVWFAGAGGPIGRMHVQRALELDQPPAFLVCTDVNDLRLRDLEETFAGEALAKGAQLRCLNPQRPEHAKELAACRVSGFDDVIILAPAAAVISECFGYLAPGGVMNIFAGVERGTLATLDLSAVAGKQARIIGQSGSTIDDLRKVLELVEKRKLSTNRSVAAIGSLSAARDGLRAVMETRYPGKVVLFPHLRDLPLTPLPDLKDRLPRVFAKLKDGREWTLEAEAELLREMLKDRSAPEQKSGAGELF